MSKPPLEPWSYADRIPTYEESIATSSSSSPPPPSSRLGEKSVAPNSASSFMRQERSRRILHLVTETIVPCFTAHLSQACNDLTVVVVPADGLPSASKLTLQNVATPSLRNETTASIVTLQGDDNRASFWTQPLVVQETDWLLRRELGSGTALSDDLVATPMWDSPPAAAKAPLLVPAPPTAPLPPRPGKKSWFKRTFELPGPDHDPTGETGKWNLGWRTPEAAPAAAAESSGQVDSSPGSTLTGKRRALRADEIAVHTRLQDVSFRTENEMGLWESTTVRCIWVEIEVGM